MPGVSGALLGLLARTEQIDSLAHTMKSRRP